MCRKEESGKMKQGFVIWNIEYGYYTGHVLYSSEFSVYYITSTKNKNDENVKVYTSEKRAINAAEKLVEKCQDFNSYKIEPY